MNSSSDKKLQKETQLKTNVNLFKHAIYDVVHCKKDKNTINVPCVNESDYAEKIDMQNDLCSLEEITKDKYTQKKFVLKSLKSYQCYNENDTIKSFSSQDNLYAPYLQCSNSMFSCGVDDMNSFHDNSNTDIKSQTSNNSSFACENSVRLLSPSKRRTMQLVDIFGPPSSDLEALPRDDQNKKLNPHLNLDNNFKSMPSTDHIFHYGNSSRYSDYLATDDSSSHNSLESDHSPAHSVGNNEPLLENCCDSGNATEADFCDESLTNDTYYSSDIETYSIEQDMSSESNCSLNDLERKNKPYTLSDCMVLHNKGHILVDTSCTDLNVIQIFIKSKHVENHTVVEDKETKFYDRSNSVIQKRSNNLPGYSPELLLLHQSPGFIDSHCHLDLFLNKREYNGSFASFRRENASEFPPCYIGCIASFCYPDIFMQKCLWEKHLSENVWVSFGCHPKRAALYSDTVEAALSQALKHSQVKALGEIGLDYSNGNLCSNNTQKKVFIRQLHIAISKNLPVVIHCRRAYEDCFNILKSNVPKDYKIHIHCFRSSWKWAELYLKEFPNLCIGITNVVTFPGAHLVHKVIRKIPLTKLLLETDAPYFVPAPISKNTSCSHPGMAIHVAAQVSALKNIPFRHVLHQTLENTNKFYNL